MFVGLVVLQKLAGDILLAEEADQVAYLLDLDSVEQKETSET